MFVKTIISAALILSTISAAQAEIHHIDNIKGFTKVESFYKRYDADKQPVYHSLQKGVKLLEEVNTHFNKTLNYINEKPGASYYQTPAETIKLNGGDCEDFATIKWSALINNGIPETDMYFLTGYNERYKEFHTVLVVLLDKKLYYLDNLTDNLHEKTISDLGSYTINRFGVNFYIDTVQQILYNH